MRNILTYIFLTFLWFGCNDSYLKEVKYRYDEEYYDCIAKVKNEKIIEIYCLDEMGDTIISEKKKSHLTSGDFSFYHSNGRVKEQGKFINNMRVDVWKGFYPNGNIRYYNFYKKNTNKEELFYSKYYDTIGRITHGLLPVHIRTDSIPDKIYVGENFKLYLDLQYSEYDSTNTFFIVSSDNQNNLDQDTFLFAGSTALLDVSPKMKGENVIKGTYFEVPIDSVEEYDLEYLSQFNFEYKFDVKSK